MGPGMSARGPTKWRGFWAFFGIGFVANIVFYTAWLVWAVVAADFLPRAPLHSKAEAWRQIAMSPGLAVILTIFGSLLALIIAALVAKYVCATKGRFPASLILVLLVVCVLAALLQMTLLGFKVWHANPNRTQEIVRLAVAQVPMLVLFWLWGREPAAHPRAGL
jgi:hypothetical protein